MVSVRDYIGNGEDRLVGMSFFSQGCTGLDFVIKGFYGSSDQRMVSIDGMQGEARFPMGSVKLADILDCKRSYI